MIVAGVGLYEIWLHWASTRIWTPLDTPVSLSPGHIRTAEFRINTRSTYRLAFVARGGFGHASGSVYEYCLPDLGASWTLSNRGQVVARGSGQSCDWLGRFDAGEGRYILDVAVSRDGSRFNDRNPRLSVFEAGGVQEAASGEGALAFWTFIVLATPGAGIVLYSGFARRREKTWHLTAPEWELPPLAGIGGRMKATAIRRPIVPTYLLGDRRAAARHPLIGLPAVALVAATTYLCLVTVVWNLQSIGRPIPLGLPLRLMRPVQAAAQKAVGIPL